MTRMLLYIFQCKNNLFQGDSYNQLNEITFLFKMYLFITNRLIYVNFFIIVDFDYFHLICLMITNSSSNCKQLYQVYIFFNYIMNGVEFNKKFIEFF